MRLLFLLSCTLLTLAACQQNPLATIASTTTDTLSYRYDTMTQRNRVCRGEEDSCAIITFRYPVFTGHGASALNARVQRKLCEGYTDTMLHATTAEVMQQFLSSYDTMLASWKDYATPWFYEKTITVQRQAGGYICLQTSVYEFAGGAHPNSYIQYQHIDMKSNRELKISDWLKDADDKPLYRLAETLFRKDLHLSSDAQLDTAGFFFDKGQFGLPVNYYFDDTALVFFYNDYEIRCHAEGPYDLVIPYRVLKPLMKMDSRMPPQTPKGA